jgi:hypothetical protein
MSTENDVARSLRSWLRESRHEDANRVLDAVFDQVSATPQRRAGWLARRFPIMNNTMRIAIAAAVVMVIAVVGFQFLSNSNTGGPGATETLQPTATPAVTPEPSAAGALPLGPHTLCEIGSCDVGMTITIGAADWFGEGGGRLLIKNDNSDPPDGAAMIVFTGPLYVYGDACQWSTTQAETPATTVDELVAALAAQMPRDASEPMDITVDGYSGKEITLHVPDDAAYSAGEFTDCDEGFFGSWTVSQGLEPYRYHQGPGQIDELLILDVDGVLTVIDTSHYAGTPAEHVEELRAIVESLQFELP